MAVCEETDNTEGTKRHKSQLSGWNLSIQLPTCCSLWGSIQTVIATWSHIAGSSCCQALFSLDIKSEDSLRCGTRLYRSVGCVAHTSCVMQWVATEFYHLHESREKSFILRKVSHFKWKTPILGEMLKIRQKQIFSRKLHTHPIIAQYLCYSPQGAVYWLISCVLILPSWDYHLCAQVPCSLWNLVFAVAYLESRELFRAVPCANVILLCVLQHSFPFKGNAAFFTRATLDMPAQLWMETFTPDFKKLEKNATDATFCFPCGDKKKQNN